MKIFLIITYIGVLAFVAADLIPNINIHDENDWGYIFECCLNPFSKAVIIFHVIALIYIIYYFRYPILIGYTILSVLATVIGLVLLLCKKKSEEIDAGAILSGGLIGSVIVTIIWIIIKH